MAGYVIWKQADPYAGRYLIMAGGRVIESTNSKRHAMRVAQQAADWYAAHRVRQVRTVLENCGDVLRVVYRTKTCDRKRRQKLLARMALFARNYFKEL